MRANRRAFGRVFLSLLGAAALLGPDADASAPQQRAQAPGYYRFLLGDIEITALSDGTIPFDARVLLRNVSEAQLQASLDEAFLTEPVEASVNAFLVNTGTRLVLIDAGAGALYGPSLGKLRQNLEAAGYRPEQVDEVYLTHMHGDHVGGLLANDRPAFPNATVRAAQAEADYWLSQSTLDAAPKDRQEGFRTAMHALEPYQSRARFAPFASSGALVTGVNARISAGHTAGHAFYVVESKGQTLVVCGDVVHVAAVQFPDPAVSIILEYDSKAAAREREAIFAEAEATHEWVAGAHLPFPGIGHVRRAARGYQFVPANYSVPH